MGQRLAAEPHGASGKESRKRLPSALAPEAAATTATQARKGDEKRDEKRDDKVGAGTQELQTWIHDLAREGLASVRSLRGIVLCGPAPVDGLVARVCGGCSRRPWRVSLRSARRWRCSTWPWPT
jgi:hypothetical protein